MWTLRDPEARLKFPKLGITVNAHNVTDELVEKIIADNPRQSVHFVQVAPPHKEFDPDADDE